MYMGLLKDNADVIVSLKTVSKQDKLVSGGRYAVHMKNDLEFITCILTITGVNQIPQCRSVLSLARK